MIWTDDPVRDAERWYTRPCAMCVCDDETEYCEDCNIGDEWEEDET